MRRYRAVTVLAGLLAAVSCSSATFQTAEDFRTQNQDRLAHLRVGMQRDEVISIMGTDSMHPLGTESSGAIRTAEDTMGVQQVQIPIGARGPKLYNPMRTATYAQADRTWEVLFYYSRLAEDDGVITDDELTPVVLEDGYLAGVGWTYWNQTARAAGIDLELVGADQ